MSTPFFQNLDPAAAPSPVTPADSPSDAAGWAEVTPSTTEPAPYSISAPQSIDEIAAAVSAAGALSGAGIVYPQGPRQSEAQAILESMQGAGAMNVLAGFPDYESADVSPGVNMANPIQGMGDYPGTTQDGLPMFTGGLGAGVEGVPPEGGSMAGSADMDYPGTTQDGLRKYGTS